MADEIAYATSLTDGDVLNVIRALIRQVKVRLATGKIVKMEDMEGPSEPENPGEGESPDPSL